ncbi:unnamed protein product [Diamesa serratosioi]
MSDYHRSRPRSRSPISSHNTYRSNYRCVYERDGNTARYSKDLWINDYYRKKERIMDINRFKSLVYSNHITSNNNRLNPRKNNKRDEWNDYQREPRRKVQTNKDIPKEKTPDANDVFDPITALRLTLKESKDVKCDVIDITDDDDDVIFVADSRTSPPEVITILDNEKEDTNINVICVCRQLIVLEEFLKDYNMDVKSLFNKALALERINVNSSTSLLTNANLKFLGSLMEKLKNDVVTDVIPEKRVPLVKKLINDIIYLVENTEEIVEQVEMELEVPKEKDQEIPTVIEEPKQTTEKILEKIPTIDEQSTSGVKPTIDISKYDNKRMKIAVDIGKALLANGKKIITPEELDALVNVYLVVTAEMSDSESDDD